MQEALRPSRNGQSRRRPVSPNLAVDTDTPLQRAASATVARAPRGPLPQPAGHFCVRRPPRTPEGHVRSGSTVDITPLVRR